MKKIVKVFCLLWLGVVVPALFISSGFKRDDWTEIIILVLFGIAGLAWASSEKKVDPSMASNSNSNDYPQTREGDTQNEAYDQANNNQPLTHIEDRERVKILTKSRVKRTLLKKQLISSGVSCIIVFLILVPALGGFSGAVEDLKKNPLYVLLFALLFFVILSPLTSLANGSALKKQLIISGIACTFALLLLLAFGGFEGIKNEIKNNSWYILVFAVLAYVIISPLSSLSIGTVLKKQLFTSCITGIIVFLILVPALGGFDGAIHEMKNSPVVFVIFAVLVFFILRPIGSLKLKKGSYKSRNLLSSYHTLSTIDSMEGHLFEEWCAALLKENGFTEVEVTPESGDQGVDVIAWKNSVKYAVQCKRFRSNLGNTPVQEVYAGKTIYGCDVAAVMTNSYFTPGAIEAAKKTGVLLWDRNTIKDMLDMASSKTAHWIQRSHMFKGADYKCSLCGKTQKAPYLNCPSCGADMRKSKYDPMWVDEIEEVNAILDDLR